MRVMTIQGTFYKCLSQSAPELLFAMYAGQFNFVKPFIYVWGRVWQIGILKIIAPYEWFDG